MLEVHAYDETAPTVVRDMLAGGFDPHRDEALALATEAATFDERTAYRENGNEIAGRVGGSERSAQVLALLIEAGLPNPGALLRRVRAPEVARVLLAARPSQPDIDAGLLGQCDEHSFDPNLEILTLLLAASPSQAALDEALRLAARGAARYQSIAVDFTFLDVFDAFIAAGARADHGAGEGPTALHLFTQFAPPHLRGDRHVEKRAGRVKDLLARAVRGLPTVDVVDELGLTPLHYACRDHIPDRITFLLRAGADVRRATADGRTTADLVEGNADSHAALGIAPPVPRPPRGRGIPRVRPAPPPLNPLRVGIRVRHVKFGFGEIVSVEGSGDKFGVRFDDGESKVMAAAFITPL